MTDLEALYLKLPTVFQNAVCSLQGWNIQRTRFGADFGLLLREAESRTFWSEDQMRDYRNRRLHAFVQHCVNTVPFYRERFREWGIRPDDIQTLEDMQHLPVLTKEEVQQHYPRLLSEGVQGNKQLIVHTSGTTGGGLRFATTLATIQEQWAVWWRYRRWHGLDMGVWCGYFGGRSVVPLGQISPPFWRYNIPGKQILFSAYHMNRANLEAYAKELRTRRPPWLHGYPSLLALLAAYILEAGFDLKYHVRWITIGAENLMPQQTALIERAFGVRPIQHYGLAEGAANISECPNGTLHVDEDFAAVEFIPNGDSFRVIGTNFTNLATPLLRYDTQDQVTISSEVLCTCGRPGRIVSRIDGRQEDYVILKNGARLGRMDHIFKDLVNIREAQIYQMQPGELIIRIVRGKQYSDDDEAMLLREVHKRVGNQADIVIEYVEALERSRAGKLRFVVSDVVEGQLERL